MIVWKKKWRAAKKRMLAWLVATIGQKFLDLILFTCRIEIHGWDLFLEAAKSGKCILMFWHNRLGPIPLFLKRCPGAAAYTYNALISKSQDGELIAKVIKRYPQGKVIRVAHDAKFQAAREAIQQLSTTNNVICITPDGPQGPRYQVKPGVALMAKTSKAQIIPLSWSGSRFWQLNTWDRLMLPKPFSKVVVQFGLPISLPTKVPKEPGFFEVQLESLLLETDQRACKKISFDPSVWPK